MDCDRAQAHLSAMFDDESPSDAAVDAHVSRCAPCRDFAADLRALDARVRLAPAILVPDLTESILTAVQDQRAMQPPARTRDIVTVLGLAGLVQVALALPALLSGADAHVARELGGWQLALGVAFLVTAWQPRRAPGLLPFVAVATVLGLVLSVQDLVAGQTTVLSEIGHLVDVIALGLVARLARQAGVGRRRVARAA